MVTPYAWPQVAEPASPRDEAAPVVEKPAPPLGFNIAAFGASLGPELSRAFGARIASRLVNEEPQPDSRMLVASRMAVRGGALLFELDCSGASALADRMLGGRAAGAHPPVEALPPASGSWLAFARLLAQVCGQSAASAGCPSTAPLGIPSRPAPWDLDQEDAFEAAAAVLQLDIEGVAGRLVVHLLLPGDERPRTAGTGRATARDIDAWRQRAHALALALDLPVSLRLAETRIPMARIAALRPGDIIPIEPPRMVSVMVGGRCFAQMPVDGINPSPTAPENKDQR
jgi:flagellar motor switch/type III secretory pathway protein FliN